MPKLKNRAHRVVRHPALTVAVGIVGLAFFGFGPLGALAYMAAFVAVDHGADYGFRRLDRAFGKAVQRLAPRLPRISRALAKAGGDRITALGLGLAVVGIGLIFVVPVVGWSLWGAGLLGGMGLSKWAGVASTPRAPVAVISNPATVAAKVESAPITMDSPSVAAPAVVIPQAKIRSVKVSAKARVVKPAVAKARPALDIGGVA